MGEMGQETMRIAREHYRLVGPLLEKSFAESPIVFANYPNGFDERPHYHVTSIELSAEKLLWLVHREYAIEFFTWAPTLFDTAALRFGRIVLTAPAVVAFEAIRQAAAMMRALLLEISKLKAIPVLDGENGITLWIPFADAPQADRVRVWLHKLCNRAIEDNPDLVSGAFNTVLDGRVHLHVQSNAPNLYSSMPYSLRGRDLAVCLPFRWDDIDRMGAADEYAFDTMRQWLDGYGDIFANQVKAIGKQNFSEILEV